MLKKTLERSLVCKEIKTVNPKGNQAWIFIGRNDAEVEAPNTLATWYKEPTHLKRPQSWERLRTGEVRGRGWDDWMASPTQWTWVWANLGRWWRTGKPGNLQSMGSQRVGHYLETDNKNFWWFHLIRLGALDVKQGEDNIQCWWGEKKYTLEGGPKMAEE